MLQSQFKEIKHGGSRSGCRDSATGETTKQGSDAAAKAGAIDSPASPPRRRTRRPRKIQADREEHLLQGTAAAKRLQISADNAADSYARSMRQAAEAEPVNKPAKAAAEKPAKTKAKKGKADCLRIGDVRRAFRIQRVKSADPVTSSRIAPRGAGCTRHGEAESEVDQSHEQIDLDTERLPRRIDDASSRWSTGRRSR